MFVFVMELTLNSQMFNKTFFFFDVTELKVECLSCLRSFPKKRSIHNVVQIHIYIFFLIFFLCRTQFMLLRARSMASS